MLADDIDLDQHDYVETPKLADAEKLALIRVRQRLARRADVPLIP